VNAGGSGTSKRSKVGWLFAMTSVCAFAVTPLAPQGAWAAPSYQPDVFLEGSFGQHVYDVSGDSEMEKVSIHRGETRDFHFWNGNDGTASDSYYYSGCNAFGPFRVKWLDPSGADVSAAVIAGTYAPGDVLGPGASIQMLDLHIKAKPSADRGDKYWCAILASSNGDYSGDAAGYTVRVVR